MRLAGIILALTFVAFLPFSHHGNENPETPGTCTVQACPDCSGKGVKTVYMYPKHQGCNGTGTKKCTACDGDGIRGFWYGEPIDCTVCTKKGKVKCPIKSCVKGFDHSKEKLASEVKCGSCSGSGKVNP